jgi:hypothetical protein
MGRSDRKMGGEQIDVKSSRERLIITFGFYCYDVSTGTERWLHHNERFACLVEPSTIICFLEWSAIPASALADG